jgi:chitodextrinase
MDRGTELCVFNRFAIASSSVALLVLGLLGGSSLAYAAIGFVQSKNNSPNNASLGTLSATFPAAQTAGNLNVVAIGWGGGVTVSSVTDTKGNTYTLAVGPTATSFGNASIYFAKNIAAAGAGGNSVTVTFSAAAGFPDIRIAEYSGINTTAPLDVTAVATGTGTTGDSGFATTSNANDLLVGSSYVTTGNTGPGTGYSQREISGWDGDILEDRIVSAAGAYNATAPLSPSGNWIMQMAAFKGASSGGGGGGDTTPPSAPTSLSATAISTSQINLNWTASTDNVGVTGYRVERCQGAGCTSFAQVGTPTGTSYSDSGLTTSTTYVYRVRATDAAGNLSGYSTSAAAITTGSSDTTPPSTPGGLHATNITASQVSLSWTAATDNVGVTGYFVERCQGDACQSFGQAGAPTGTTYTDAGLSGNTAYTYRVRAGDAAGNRSAYSGVVSVVTLSGSGGTCHP